jgi:hypothetical protein
MELKEFVKATLASIIEAVSEAQEGAHGGNVSPHPSRRAGNLQEGSYESTWGLYASPVRFDVAVTVTGADKLEGGVKVSVLALSAGGGASTSNEKQSVSRVQFEVPLALPTSRKKPLFAQPEGETTDRN